MKKKIEEKKNRTKLTANTTNCQIEYSAVHELLSSRTIFEYSIEHKNCIDNNNNGNKYKIEENRIAST